jgi:hypothetical protein
VRYLPGGIFGTVVGRLQRLPGARGAT